MKIDSVFVLSYIKGKQIGQGGYYGADLSDLAKVMKVTYRAVRMRLTTWIKENLEAKIPYQQRHFIEERTRLNYRYSQITRAIGGFSKEKLRTYPGCLKSAH